MLGILRQKVGAGSSSAMRIRPATSAKRGFASSAKEVEDDVNRFFFWLVRIGQFRRPCHRGT
ncbi:hypothetical protein C1H46_010951 [Malus baccata]|uniref:Uncharacterized protein n=1 Tax=Malus baccata TaxID=106549 RepID=A0A540MXE5_MALBA|nr:hypothetical protein C1H46_010951 [Malus baccata]